MKPPVHLTSPDAMRKARTLHVLQAALQVKDRPLRRTHRERLLHARKTAAEKQCRSLRHEHHAVADFPPEQITGGRLSTAGTAGEDDTTAAVV